MTDVFVSYSRQNIDFARKLVDALKHAGRESWVDWESIPLSAQWWDEIKSGIDKANAFVIVITPDSIASAVCALEIAHAIANHKRIIPVVHHEPDASIALGQLAAATITGTLADMLAGQDLLGIARDNWRVLQSINWVFFSDEDDFDSAFAELISAVETDLERVRLHTRLLVRAHQWASEEHDDSYLLVGTELREAASWLTVYGEDEPQATAEHRAFIQASLDKEARDQAERQQQIEELNTASERAQSNRRRAFIAIGAALLVGVVAAGITLNANAQIQTATATIQEARGVAESLRLAQLADTYLEPEVYNAEVASLLATRALFNGYTPQADAALEAARQGLHSRQIFLGHTAQVDGVAFTPDGTTLMTAGRDKTIRLWDVATGDVQRVIDSPLSRNLSFNSIAIASDGRVAARVRDKVALYDLTRADNPLLHLTEDLPFSGNWLQYVNQWNMAFSTDGNSLLTREALYRVDDAGTLAPAHEFTCCGAMTANGQFALVVDNQETGEQIQFYALDNPEAVTIMTLPDDTGRIGLLAISPDSRLGAAAAGDDILLWDTRSGDHLLTLAGHTGPIHDLAFSPDNLWLASASDDTTVRIWDMTTRSDQPERILTGNIEGVLDVAFSPDSRFLASGGLDRTARLYAVGTAVGAAIPEALQWLPLAIFMPSFGAHALVAHTPDGRYTLERFDSKKGHYLLRWQDTVSGQQVEGFLAPALQARSGATVWNSLRLSVDGQRLLTTLGSSRNDLWDTATGELLRTIDDGGFFARFSPDNSHIISLNHVPSQNQSILQNPEPSTRAVFWNVDRSVQINVPGEQTTGAAIAPDNQLVAIAYNNLIRLWDVSGQQAQLRGILRGHTGQVQFLTFSADGQLLVTAGADNRLRVWDVAAQTMLRALSISAPGQIATVAFDPAAGIIYANDSEHISAYDLQFETLLTTVCTTLQRDFVAAERVEFALDDSGTCPA